MSWIRIWVHLVFSTKFHEQYLTKEIRKLLFRHILENAVKKNIWIDRIGGYNDHVHCLISLRGEQTISRVAQMIKGESSFWLNDNYFKHGIVLWQDDFWAVSVCESHIKSLRKYIENQEKHHKDCSFEDELVNFRMIKQG
jgi:putative transposase